MYHYPSVSELLAMIKTYSPRIYEKTPLHFDFLFYRLGLGYALSSSDISYSNKERGKETDDLEKSGYELYTKSLELNEMPVLANLMNGPVGYIGPRNLVLEQLHLLVNQLSVFHSYHENVSHQDIYSLHDLLEQLNSWQNTLNLLNDFFSDKQRPINKKKIASDYYACSQIFSSFHNDFS